MNKSPKAWGKELLAASNKQLPGNAVLTRESGMNGMVAVTQPIGETAKTIHKRVRAHLHPGAAKYRPR